MEFQVSNASSRAETESSSLRRQPASSMSLVSMNNKRTDTSINGDAKLPSTVRKKEKVTDLPNSNKKQSKLKPSVKSRPGLPKIKSAPNIANSTKSSSFTCKPNGLKMTFTVSKFHFYEAALPIDSWENVSFYKISFVKLSSN